MIPPEPRRTFASDSTVSLYVIRRDRLLLSRRTGLPIISYNGIKEVIKSNFSYALVRGSYRVEKDDIIEWNKQVRNEIVERYSPKPQTPKN